MNIKRVLIISIPPALLCIILLVLYNVGYAGNKQRTEQLAGIDGVISVKEIWQLPRVTGMSEKYMVTFEQPLDWSDPSAGTFPQRVEVAIHDNARINVIETNGYCLPDMRGKMRLSTEKAPETAEFFDGNHIHIEHRFFGDSRPEGMSNTGIRYWNYHTAENAANDYHRIYKALSPLLGDKWICTGRSRGGLMTNVYGFYFPEDMLAYVPYVAPCSDGVDDRRFYEFVYTQIGNDAYGDEKAEELRDLVTAFQVEVMKDKEALLPDYKKKISAKTYAFWDQVTPEVLFDLNVLEFAVQYWQYGSDFDEIRKVLDMPETTEKEQKEKQKAVYRLLLSIQDPDDWSTGCLYWPYYVNTATTYGQYLYDFSYLRDALSQAGLSDTLSVTEDMEKDFLQNIVFSEEQKAAFVYDGGFREALVSSMATTRAKHLMIFGAVDPWYSVAIPASENDNIRIFVHPTMPHTARISNLPEDMQEEAWDILSEWIGEEHR